MSEFPRTFSPDLGDDPDGDLDEIEAIAEARAAGYGYQPVRFDPAGED